MRCLFTPFHRTIPPKWNRNWGKVHDHTLVEEEVKSTKRMTFTSTLPIKCRLHFSTLGPTAVSFRPKWQQQMKGPNSTAAGTLHFWARDYFFTYTSAIPRQGQTDRRGASASFLSGKELEFIVNITKWSFHFWIPLERIHEIRMTWHQCQANTEIRVNITQIITLFWLSRHCLWKLLKLVFRRADLA